MALSFQAHKKDSSPCKLPVPAQYEALDKTLDDRKGDIPWPFKWKWGWQAKKEHYRVDMSKRAHYDTTNITWKSPLWCIFVLSCGRCLENTVCLASLEHNGMRHHWACVAEGATRETHQQCVFTRNHDLITQDNPQTVLRAGPWRNLFFFLTKLRPPSASQPNPHR